MASVVVWETSHEQWMADNKEGQTHFFDDKAAAIQSACSMERNKDKPKIKVRMKEKKRRRKKEEL